jgi:hypothetical protein
VCKYTKNISNCTPKIIIFLIINQNNNILPIIDNFATKSINTNNDEKENKGIKHPIFDSNHNNCSSDSVSSHFISDCKRLPRTRYPYNGGNILDTMLLGIYSHTQIKL